MAAVCTGALGTGAQHSSCQAGSQEQEAPQEALALAGGTHGRRLDARDRRPCRHHSSAFGFVRLPVVSVTATFGSGTVPCTLQ